MSFMKTGDLKNCNGYDVELTLDGHAALAVLDSSDPQAASLRTILPKTADRTWHHDTKYMLTPEDIASLLVNGECNLFSTIVLSSDMLR